MKNLKSKIFIRVQESPQFVFLREDFLDLGDYDKVSRALRQVIEEGILERISIGVYAKTRPSLLDPSKLALAAPGGFKQVARETLNQMAIEQDGGGLQLQKTHIVEVIDFAIISDYLLGSLRRRASASSREIPCWSERSFYTSSPAPFFRSHSLRSP